MIHRLSIVFISAVGALVACAQEAGEPDFPAAVLRLNDAVAAEVDGSPIYVSDVIADGVSQGLIEHGEALNPQTALFDQLLEELIDQRLLAQEAVRRELHDTDESRRRIATARERILGNVLVETVLDTSVTEDTLRRLYEEQVKLVELGDEVRAREIVVETEAKAGEIYDLLGEGADFAQLAFEHSLNPTTRLEGGDMGYFTPEMAPLPIARVAFSTEIGVVAQPFRTELGWHVLRVEDRRVEARPTFEEMRPRMVRFLTFDEIQKLLDVLRARSEVRRFAGAGADGEPQGAEALSNDVESSGIQDVQLRGVASSGEDTSSEEGAN